MLSAVPTTPAHHATVLRRRAALAAGTVVCLVAGLLAAPAIAAPAQPAAAATAHAADVGPGDFGTGSTDLAVNGWGDSAGYHLEVGREATAFVWHEVAVLSPDGYDAGSWTGYQCVSGDGRYAAVAILPTLAANAPAARDHGGFAYSVDLNSGAVHPVAAGVAVKYYTPGCGTADRAVFTVNLGTDQQSTRLLTADLATGTVTRSVTVAGQVTSAVPVRSGLLGVLGSTLATIPASGKPSVVASVHGTPFDVRPAADGGVNFLVATAGSSTATAQHERGGRLTLLGSGALTRMRLFGGRAGGAVLTGASTTVTGAMSAAGVRAVGDSRLPHGATAASLDGDALIGPATDRQSTDPVLLATHSGKLVARDQATRSAGITTALPRYRIALSAKDFSSAPKGKPQPKGDAAYVAGTAKPAAAPADAQTPTCSIPRLDANRQVLQPDPAQVNWAAQMAEQGKLTGSAYTRPAGYANLGLAAYAPNSDFPLIPLSHPSGGGSTVPRSVYEAIMAQESNWSQASWHATKGVSGDPLIADYYGAGGGIDSINYAGADCGYGIGQVTTGMRIGDTEFSVHGQMKVAVDYEENIAAGLQILESIWNELYADGITVNNGDPSRLENWYLAVWAYNSGIQPTSAYNSTGCTPGPTCTGPDGTWGLGWSNNPANPDYPPNRDPFLKDTYADAAHPSSWPYQERVMGWMASPILRYSHRAYSLPAYHGGNTWIQPAPFNTFCTVAENHCDPDATNPTQPDAGHCMLADYECWWHVPVTWVSDCATNCATSAYEVGTGSTEPSDPDEYPPTCQLNTAVVPSNAIIVDDEPTPTNLQGCHPSNWSNDGTFTMAYGTDAAGDPVGAIDMHQLGSGLGGRVLFSHVETGANPVEINTGTWTPVLPKLQYYKIKIHFPALGARATNVIYTINPGGGVAPWKYRVNQAWNSEQWATIATVAMQNGGSVQLSNLSSSVATDGSDYTQNDVAWDAIAFIPMGGTPGQPIGGPPRVIDEPKGSNPAWVNCGCVKRTAGDPVDTATGYFGQTWTDLTTPGRGEALAFTRTYAEAVADPAGPNAAGAVDGPFGWGWTYSYNISAHTDGATGDVTVRQEDGSQVTFVDTAGTYTASAPRYDATLTTDGSSYTFTRRGRDIFVFDVATGRLTAEMDVDGQKATPQYRTTLAYDAAGHLHTITDPAGRSYTLTWTGDHITELADSAGRTVSYAYDAFDDLTDVYGVGTTRTPTLQDNDHTRFGYDTTRHLMTSMRSPANFGGPAGAQTSMTYDSSERVSTQTDAAGHTTTFTYGPNGGLATGQTLTTDPAGHKTLDTYAGGLLVSQTKGYGTADAGTWSYTYDPVTLGISSQTDPNGNLTTYSYDDRGNRISTSDARGYTTNFKYDDAGHLVETVDPTGVATVDVYDQADHLPTGVSGLSDLTSSTVTEANNVVESSTGNFGDAPLRTTNFYYDDPAHPGDLNRTVDPAGHTTTVAYDAYGDKVSSTDGAGDKTLYGYDTGTGRLTSRVDPDGTAAGVTAACTPPAVGCTTYRYDEFGNATTVTDPLGHVTTSTYDADGNQLTVTDPAARTTVNTYNAVDELTSTLLPDGTTTATDYNPDGTIHAATDELGHQTTFGYDGQGRQVSRTDPDGRTTTADIDPGGLLRTSTDPQGRVTTMGYDAAGDTTAVSYSDGVTPDVTFGYDPDGNRTSMTDGSGTTTWTFNTFGDIVATTNGAGMAVSYGRDGDGNVTSISYPGQTTPVRRTYDAANRLKTVVDPAGNTTTFGYDADGGLKTTTYPNGTVITNGFDNAESLTSIALTKGGATLAAMGLGRDALNEVASITTGGTTSSVTYDSRQQLTGAGSTTAFAYDATGNPTTIGSATQAFDAAGQICWRLPSGTVTAPLCGTVPTGATAYTFDPEGDRTAAGAGSYGYDQAGRLTSVTGPAGSATYQYDGTGLRTAKTTGGTTTTYLWDAEPTADLLYDGTTSYLYGPGGLPIEQIGPAGTTWFLHDQVGSTTALIDTSGTIVGAYTYTPYGLTTHSGTATTPLQFTGQYHDTESGLLYLRARYYDPTTAQFLTLDPLIDRTGTPYSYVGNDPLNGTDPNGQCGFWCWTGIGAAVVGTAACIILEPCGIVEGGGLVVAGGSVAALGGISFTGGSIVAGGAAIGGLLGAGGYAASQSRDSGRGGGSSGDSGGSGGSGARPNSGVSARPLSDIPGSTGCEDVAEQIQSRIGGQIYKAEPPPGASNLGPYRGEDSFWANHEFVVKDGYAYDSWTGPEGEPLQEYKEQFEWWDVINFAPK